LKDLDILILTSSVVSSSQFSFFTGIYLTSSVVSSKVRVGILQHQAVDVVHVKVLQHGLGIRINLNVIRLHRRLIRHVVILTLSLLFLQRKRNSSNGTLGDTLHQIRHVSTSRDEKQEQKEQTKKKKKKKKKNKKKKKKGKKEKKKKKN
jgi:hypothetical protein